VGDSRLRAWLRDVILPEGERMGCATQHPLDITYDATNGAEFDYWFARLTQGPNVSGREILRMLGYGESLVPRALQRAGGSVDHEWRRHAVLEGMLMLLVIDHKTVAWARGQGDVSYYPDVRPLDPALLSSLRKRCQAQVRDGRFAVIAFPPEPAVRSENSRVRG
jgi:hypothetical protein